MKRRIITLQCLVRFVKFCVAPMGVWPLSTRCSRFKVLARNIVWSSALFMATANILGMIYALSKMPDFHAVIEIMSEITAVSAVILKLLIFKAYDDSLQKLLVEFEEFLEQMSPEENEFFQNYLQKSIRVHLFYMICCIVAPLTFIGVSVLNWGRWLPGTAIMPIPSDTSWGWTIIFIQHAWTTWLVGCMGNLDVLFLSLLWSVTVRFEILALEYSRATSVTAFTMCIKKQQIIINYSRRLVSIVRWVVVSVNAITVGTVTFGGFFIILQPETKDVVTFLTMLFDVIFELFLYTWAGEKLMESSTNVGYAVYSSNWFGASPKLLQDMRIVMRRSAKPEIITVNGLIPIVGLQFFGSVLSMIFSYIATLRAVTIE